MGRPDPLIQSWRAFSKDKDRPPLVRTGCGYLPIGALPTGYLPIGALPTGGAGGGGSLRGRSAAAAALSMPKEAAVTVRNFSIVNPLLFEPHLSDEAANAAAGAAPPDDCSDFHRCTGKMPQPRPPHNQKGTFPSVLRSLFPRLLHKHHVSR